MVSFCLFSLIKLHNIPIPTQMRITVIIDQLIPISGFDCIFMVLLKNCRPPKLSYIFTELFYMCLKESCFPDFLKVSCIVTVFKNIVEWKATKNYHLVNLLSVVNKIFENLNRFFDQAWWYLIPSMILSC